LRELEESQASLERAGSLLNQIHSSRSRLVLNQAQIVSCTKELLAYDWHDEDVAAAAA